MKKIILITVAFVTAFSAMAANAGNLSGSSYEGNEARRMQYLQTGTVEDIREVTVTDRSNMGQYGSMGIGGALGGLLGQKIGNGNGRIAATVVMAAVGAAAGNKVNEYVSTDKALEIIVSLDDGRAVAITQTLDNDASSLQVGDRVRIIQGANVRVVRMRTNVGSM